MKNFALIAALLIAACTAVPSFKTAEYAPFGEEKYPAMVLWVNSGQACFYGKTNCTYGDKFLEKLNATGAFHNLDVYNTQADYRLKIQFHARGGDGTSVHEKTAGILPSHVKKRFDATFVIENEYGMLKTYTFTLTGTQLESLGADDNRDEVIDAAIESAVNNFIAALQRDKVLPLTRQ